MRETFKFIWFKFEIRRRVLVSVLLHCARWIYRVVAGVRRLDAKLSGPRTNNNKSAEPLKFASSSSASYDSEQVYGPSVTYYMVWYERIVATYLSWVLIKHLSPLESLLHEQLGWEKPLNCYFPGRFVLNHAASTGMSICICFVNLGFRIWIRNKRSDAQPLLLFMCQEPEQIRQVEREHRQHLHGRPVVKRRRTKGRRVPRGEAVLRYLMFYQGRLSRSGGGLGGCSKSNNDNDVSSLLYFQQASTAMAYRSRRSSKLRPNRSLASYELLWRRLNLVLLLGTWNFISVGPFLTAGLLYGIVSDLGYVVAYPGCSPELDRLYAEGKLGYFSFSFDSTHKLWAVFMDIVENLFLYLDSFIGILYVVPLAHLFDYDMMIYWEHCEQKIERLQARFRQSSQLQPSQYDADRDEGLTPISCECTGCSRSNTGYTLRSSSLSYPLMIRGGDSQFAGTGLANTGSLLMRPPTISTWESSAALESQIEDLLLEMNDFFEQFEQADAIVSDIMGMGFIAWLTTFACISYCTKTMKLLDNDLIAVRALQISAMIVFTVVNSSLWTINRRLVRAYQVLCSITALDRSDYKLRFLSILEYFVERKRTAFTVLGRYPLNARTYLMIISWSLSCMSIMESLY